MSARVDRNLVSQVAIVLAICVGGWMMLIQPRAQELADLQSVLDQAAGSREGGSTAALERLTNRVVELRDRIEEINAANSVAGDSSALYDGMMKLAQQSGVRVTNLSPGSEPTLERDGRVSVRRVDVAIEGTFQSAAQFIDSVESLGGFVRPSSLSVTPRQVEGRNIVSARLS
jgi:Tfp pilus assembly protein PilO